MGALQTDLDAVYWCMRREDSAQLYLKYEEK